MSQIFPKGANSFARITILALATLAGGGLFVLLYLDRTDYTTEISYVKPQAVPFSHKHHVTEVGIDCRYCHTSVEKSAVAGIPATSVCYNCHKQIWNQAPMLKPVRDSFATGEPLVWNRVHDTPDFVYFNHSIHVNKGIGCVSCHGRVDQMQLMAKASSLQMQWCLSCHRNPEAHIRPVGKMTDMAWHPTESQNVLGPKLVKEYHVQKLTNCNVCHR